MLRCALVHVVMAMLDHDDTVVMVPAAMPAIVTMLAHFGAGAVAMVAMLDDHSLSTCQRRRRNRERTQSCNHITKFLHDVLLQRNANENRAFA